MFNGIEAVTQNMLGLALDASHLRQVAISSNIANANTRGYRPLKVDFEGQLADARQSLQLRGFVEPRHLSAVQPMLSTTPEGLQEPVQVDMQMAALSENSVQYQALLKGLSRQLTLMSIAVSDGKK
ncbi:flagellar basal body rod protein FlgB [Acidovorax facilis]|uniref:flagellar basal body rod protein FlgB n=1 Tax=Acidovorax facilis TaxID=12917 RepID=UPI003CF69881